MNECSNLSKLFKKSADSDMALCVHSIYTGNVLELAQSYLSYLYAV